MRGRKWRIFTRKYEAQRGGVLRLEESFGGLEMSEARRLKGGGESRTLS